MNRPPRGRGATSSRVSLKKSDGGPSRGRGRGRGGRGRGKSSKLMERTFLQDNEDDICQQAMGKYELETSSASKALEEVNYASQLPGFDVTAGSIWIYPTNRPVRDYQLQIVKTSLFNNTLVSLPTGLGKTLIAAVTMYNFHRWYPQDLIIFMAPTRPLVTQQLKACQEIGGIAPLKTIELTGHTPAKKREELWKTKNVFFLTPQVVMNDLASAICPAERVRCVVVDEAHKATGDHAYVKAVTLILEKNKRFRVLGLSATIGRDLGGVGEVFKNLLISRVELRSETSPDVLPYSHDRNVEKIIVPLDPYLVSIHSQVVEVFQRYLGKLLAANVIRSTNLAQFQLLQARNNFRATMATQVPSYKKGYIEADFATSISLAHCIDLLNNHGLRCFYWFLQGIYNKEKATPAVTAELKKNTNLQEVLQDIERNLGIISPNASLNTSALYTTYSSKPEPVNISLTDLVEIENKQDYTLSHPKMKILRDLILAHFENCEIRSESTRAIVFSQYRDSCAEILRLLANNKRVKPTLFIGQSSTTPSKKGLKQKEQIKVIQKFRDGEYNVLISTSVGEEGLDIGDVDLIICFDASSSPTRLVQRMGRTGRKRVGRIVFLLGEGREECAYNRSMSSHSSVSKAILDPKKLEPFLYKCSARMVPSGVEPQCVKMNVLLSSEQFDDVIDIKEDDPEEKAAPLKKPKKSPRPGTASKPITDFLFKKPESPIKEQNEEEEEEQQQRPLTQEHQEIPHQLDNNFLMDLFDVVEVPKMISKPCLNIPKPLRPIKWLPEYNEIDPALILLSDQDIQCMMEKLDSMRIISQYKNQCPCGNVNNDEEEEEYNSMMQECSDSIIDSSSPVGLLDGGFEMKEDDPFFDDDDEWITKIDEYSECDSKIPEEKNSDLLNTSGAKKFTFKLKDPSHQNSSLLFEDSNYNFDLKKIETNVNSTTFSLKHQMLKSCGEIKRPEPIKNQNNSFPKPMQKFDKQAGEIKEFKHPKPFPKPPAATPLHITIPDSDSSTTSNEEAFSSPIWRQRLKEEQDKNVVVIPASDSSTTSNDEQFFSPVINRVTSNVQNKAESQSKSQVDPDLFKDDMLLFEDDFFEENMSVFEQLSLEEKENGSPPRVKEMKFEFKPTEQNNGKLNQSIYNNSSSVLFSPPTPPSIFKSSRRSRPPLSPINQKASAANTESDEEFLDMNLTAMEQSIISKVNQTKATTSKSIPVFQSDVKSKSAISKSNVQISPWIDPSRSLATKQKQVQPPKFKFKRKSPPPIHKPQINLSDDEDFIIPMSPMKRTQTQRNTFPSPSASASTMVQNKSQVFSSSPRPFPTRAYSSPSIKRKKKKRKMDGNQFIDLEAEVSDDSSLSDNEEYEGLDQYDSSFVDEEDQDHISDTQHVRYMKSVRDIIPNRIIELPPQPNQNLNDTSITMNEDVDASYESDSFCIVNDAVEFADVGVFTQAMNVARQEVLRENPSSVKRRRTRRQVRIRDEAAATTSTFMKPVAPKGRRRIICKDDSSDD